MIPASKVFGLFLACALFYLSISASSGFSQPDNDLLKGNSNNLPKSWITEVTVIYNLIKPLKNQHKSFNNFLIYSFKGFVNDLEVIWKHGDYNAAILSSRYITLSNFIPLRLNVKNIIFPFHFFM